MSQREQRTNENKPTKTRYLDLKNQRFGRLTVVELLDERYFDNSCLWLCRCDCGNMKTVSGYRLRTGNTQSCGCFQRESLVNHRTFVNGTYLECISSKKINRNNTSGYKGVYARRNGWRAYITFAGTRYYLGDYFDIHEAARVRAEAEKCRLDIAMSGSADNQDMFSEALRKILAKNTR